jgi:hypothetical protein
MGIVLIRITTVVQYYSSMGAWLADRVPGTVAVYLWYAAWSSGVEEA